LANGPQIWGTSESCTAGYALERDLNDWPVNRAWSSGTLCLPLPQDVSIRPARAQSRSYKVPSTQSLPLPWSCYRRCALDRCGPLFESIRNSRLWSKLNWSRNRRGNGAVVWALLVQIELAQYRPRHANREFNLLNSNLVVPGGRRFILGEAAEPAPSSTFAALRFQGGWYHGEITINRNGDLCGAGGIRWKRQCVQGARPHDKDRIHSVLIDGQRRPPS
jgi:hypothetical protein